MQALNC